MREKLIDAIVELAGADLRETHDIAQLLKESEEELIDRLISLAEYWKEYRVW